MACLCPNNTGNDFNQKLKHWMSWRWWNVVEVDAYRVFYKCLKIKSKFKLAAFLSYTMETKYFSKRVTSTSFGAKTTSPGQSYTNLSLLKNGRKVGGIQKMLVAAAPLWHGHTIPCVSLAVVPVPT